MLAVLTRQTVPESGEGPGRNPTGASLSTRTDLLDGADRLGGRCVRNHQLGLGLAAEGELLLALGVELGVDHHDLAGPQLAEEDLLRQGVLDLALDGPPPRAGAP